MNQPIISMIAQYFATKPVVRAYLFGSFARGENGPDSDIDILVTFDKEARAQTAEKDKVLIYERAKSLRIPTRK